MLKDSANTTPAVMDQVLLALVPGAACLVYYFGIGILINVVVSIAAATATEALVLRARTLPPAILADRSAIVTGALLGLSLPPFLPLWMAVLGASFAMIFGKHLYGGLGQNPFNPAMAGYAMMIVAFPLAMSLWPSPGPASSPPAVLSWKMGAPVSDAITMATPLDAFRFRGNETVAGFWTTSAAVAGFAGKGWQWINVAFLAGGIYLCYRRICDWVMPSAMLAALGVLAATFYDGGSARSLGSPLFHWLSGATMMAAFFIVTDPVTSPDGLAGRIIFGTGVGILVFTIRSIGAYPDGIAFAVLLMNATAPLLDQVRRRRT